MPLKKERDPSRGHHGLLRFLATELAQENYDQLMRGVLNDGRWSWRAHSIRWPAYSLKNARALQARLRDRLERTLKGGKLDLTVKDAFLVRLHLFASARMPRIKVSRRTIVNGKLKVFPRPVGTLTDRLLSSIVICPHGMPGCRRYYVCRALRPKRHCGNPACKNQHDKVRRTA
jgi:hypothetical protein